ncbi:hypothetical protein TanjilG_26830 [Lupinus angustifolius]|uniref:Glycosyltransferase 61 catalytic domain-containing protein n=1 Tax=Lupinus angustifolius TaxID=3871 RepID=A0A4P1RII0_LUPAN|nr:PREDICTED: EGF domain-specific O-linked N-acetylglucosamine transferase-like [Lupinus angustifolius]OIW11464.1 hypothetical protein TanjilG_26830 [Lupinus angustifolius]
MVNYHRFNQSRKASEFINKDDESQNHVMDCSNSVCYKRNRPTLLSFLFLITFLSFCYVLAPLFIGSSFSLFLLYSNGTEDVTDVNVIVPLCSSVSRGTICCDRSGYRSDICVMKGDIRTNPSSSSIFLYNSRITNNFSRTFDARKSEKNKQLQHEKIKPYTRKWETSVMNTIHELNLISKSVVNFDTTHDCDVKHDVPAVFFSNGGYTGNVYHEFNDGIIPLYITSQHFNKKVVFVILEYHNWWFMKYRDILSHLSDFPTIDFTRDNKTHCFPEAIIGLRIHNELAIDPSLMEGNKSIVDFRNILDKAYRPRIRGRIENEAQENLRENQLKKLKLVILSRSGSRAITNENLLMKMAENIGFQIKVLRPESKTELAKIYRILIKSDVMIGVHGAAMTHFLFLKPGSVFIQVVPIGTTWAAETYYGEPSKKLGLKYIGYEIEVSESSLYEKYDKNDPILIDPESINKKGWEYTKKIYLNSQNVTLDLGRFRKRLLQAYEYKMSKSNINVKHKPHL